jgi:hypothetical protein
MNETKPFEDLADGEEFCWAGDTIDTANVYVRWCAHDIDVQSYAGQFLAFTNKGGSAIYYADIPKRLTVKPPPPRHVAARFSFDEKTAGKEWTTFTGWHDPYDKWNGWCKPLLSREEVDRLAALFKLYHEEEDGDQWLELSWDGDTLVYGSHEAGYSNIDHVEPQTIATATGDPMVWGCGFGLVWDDFPTAKPEPTWLVINETGPQQPPERQHQAGQKAAVAEATRLVAEALSSGLKPGDLVEITLSCEDGIESDTNEMWTIVVQRV